MEIIKKTAIVVGATGLIGSKLVQQLLNDEDYSHIKVLVRRALPSSNPKLVNIVLADFDQMESVAEHLAADVAFCALGTTSKQAGSKAAFQKVDLDYVTNFARLTKQAGSKQFVLISSIGTVPNSAVFYVQTKYKAEQVVRALGFESLSILRPSLLLGPRKEARLGEKVGEALAFLLSPLMFIPALGKYKPIHVEIVARAMRALAAIGLHGTDIVENDRIHKLGKPSV
jgi:uncharacterized protein YbjT (DUF2867 family)